MLNVHAVRLVEVAGVGIPQTPLAIAAAQAAHASLPAVVTAHASRVFVFAALAARQERVACEPDTLYVAAMYTNMGLSAAYAHSNLRYEIDGADAARAFMQRYGASASVLDDVWCAIALHTTPGLPAHMSPLTRLLSSGVRADLFAANLDTWTQAERDQILAAWPRGIRFKERMIEAIGRGVGHRPMSTFGTVSADVLERVDPNFCRTNFCGLILGSPWND
ncbi:phosphohydrolase [Paraburkholderia phymatum]|uniref:Metal-dependent phosphohydrolase n=1 Tax=Paraburkholderia phymatum (strain DSM 17167 / CIP 108236 / LMG 21445 / STM815) TaxID=391038 RepID=B2JV15_PARP8|nr:phosphohydrolase [Paraburkholderia phymatum]ACC74793.1 metal-dependent phosphohydrolase [Paraburkholderia phymatum STM815]